MDKRRLITQIAMTFNAYQNCIKLHNTEWKNRHEEVIEKLCYEYLPHGSGFDSGTTFDFDNSREDRLVFNTAYHHMDEGGYYDGWTNHQVIVTPSLAFGFSLRITGKDKNDIKEYMHQVFSAVLDEKIDWDEIVKTNYGG